MKDGMDRRVVRYILLLAAAALAVTHFDWFIGFLVMIWQIINPLLMGCMIAFVMNIILKKLEAPFFPNTKKEWLIRYRRGICVALSFLLVLLTALVIMMIIVPAFSDTVVTIGSAFPALFEQAKALAEKYQEYVPAVAEYLETAQLDWQEILKAFTTYATAGLGGFLSSTFSVISYAVSGVYNFVMAAIFALYLMYHKDKLKSQAARLMQAYLPPKAGERMLLVARQANTSFASFFVGQFVGALVLGGLCILGMMIFGFPNALMIGIFIGATALIPIVGAYVGTIVGFLIILAVSPSQAFWFLIFILTLQQIEGNLVYPRIVGHSIGLPSMWVLAAVVIGGGLGGIMGMLLGVPTAATAYALLRKDVHTRLDEPESTPNPPSSAPQPAPKEKPPLPPQRKVKS